MSKKNDLDAEYEDDSYETELLTNAALRFRGYDYCEEKGVDPWDELKKFLKNQKFPSLPLEQLSIFFLLQRHLMEWGGGDYDSSEFCLIFWNKCV
jgi:hypothetical protein